MLNIVKHDIEQIKAGTKRQTRRPTDRYQVRKLYAIQPGRGKPGIPEGKIYIGEITREWKPDLSDLPEGREAIFARRWREMEAGYPIKEWAAKEEGGYTSEEFEELYIELKSELMEKDDTFPKRPKWS